MKLFAIIVIEIKLYFHLCNETETHNNNNNNNNNNIIV